MYKIIFDVDLIKSSHRNILMKFWKLYLSNQSPIRSVWRKILQEAWNGIKPKISRLRVFGSVTHVHIPNERKTKLDDKSEKYIFIGYSTHLKGYKLYNPNNKKFVISQDVMFDEEEEWDFNSSIDEFNLFS